MRARARSGLLAAVTSTVVAATALSGCTSSSERSTALDPDVRHLQAGAPGEPNTVVTEAPDTVQLGSPFTADDAAFLEGMRAHHLQALEMTALVPERAGREDLRLFAERMHISQQGEVELVDGWLAEHEAALERTGEAAQEHRSSDGHGAHAEMPGMLTQAELDAMAAARGERFVQLFLLGMTKHHQGALQMVGDLLATEGAAADPRLYQFASDVDSDQRIELDRMGRIAETVPPPT
jgi:uncharacterized protein (DUF305 family)